MQGSVSGEVGPKVKPGLSTFKTHPSDLKDFIKPLFIEAQNLVPQAQWASTPVHIKATAGMRLVTPEQERVIYDTIFAFLSTSPDVCPFSVSRGDLRTIDGKEEGYFGALSANYLSGVISPERAVIHADHGVLGALDLGGSSTQVSLYTGGEPSAAVPLSPTNFFVHSYLGFGVEKMAEKYDAHFGASGLDPCAPPGFEVGPGRVGSGDYGRCKAALTEALQLECGNQRRCVMDGVELPPVDPGSKFIGMSVYYFASRTVFAALAKAGEPSMSWPSPSLDEYRAAGERFCSMPWSKLAALAKEEGWERFMGDEPQRLVELPERCRQAAYIDLLLGSVFGVPAEKHNVMVSVRVRGPGHRTRALTPCRHLGF